MKELPIPAGDMIEIYQKKQHEKRGKWSILKEILHVNHDARSVTIDEKRNKEVSVAIENVRPAILEETLAQTVQKGIDSLDELLDEVIIQTKATEDISDPLQCKESKEDEQKHDVNFSTTDPNIEPVIGDRASIFWPIDQEFYPGQIESEANGGQVNIQYDDGGSECLKMYNETWKFLHASSVNSNQNVVISTEKCYRDDEELFWK